MHHRFLAHDRCAGSCLTTRSCMNQTQDDLMLYQLFGVGALAHRGLPSVRGFVREVPLAFPAPHHSAREGCPGHCGTMFYRTDFQQIGVTFFMPKQIWFSVPRRLLWFREQGAHPSEAVHMFKLVLLLPFPADWIHSHLPHAWVKVCVQLLTGDTFECTTNEQFPFWANARCAADCSGNISTTLRTKSSSVTVEGDRAVLLGLCRP